LGCGGYLSSLRRTRIGEFEVSEALSMEQFEGNLK
jgi:tRNA pseudouridine55 synthase